MLKGKGNISTPYSRVLQFTESKQVIRNTFVWVCIVLAEKGAVLGANPTVGNEEPWGVW